MYLSQYISLCLSMYLLFCPDSCVPSIALRPPCVSGCRVIYFVLCSVLGNTGTHSLTDTITEPLRQLVVVVVAAAAVAAAAAAAAAAVAVNPPTPSPLRQPHILSTWPTISPSRKSNRFLANADRWLAGSSHTNIPCSLQIGFICFVRAAQYCKIVGNMAAISW